jgi:predicted PurR-regulated permease PerM
VTRSPSTSSIRFLWIAAGLCLLALLLVKLAPILQPVFFALLLAYMLDPLVDRFEAARMPRSLGITVLLFVALSVLAVFLLLVLPAIVADLSELARTLSTASVRMLELTRPWLEQRGIPVPETTSAALDELGLRLMGLGGTALGPVSGMLQYALGSTASLLSALGTVLLVPIFSFYFLHDFDRMVTAAYELLPSSVRPGVAGMAREVDAVLNQFVRGQLTVMAILAVLYAGGYAAIGVPLAIPIGVLAGLLSFIPYVGSGLALVFGLLMVGLHFMGWGAVLGVVIVYSVVQVLESFVITPRIVGGQLGLSPVWVLFALAAFGQLFGFVGVMIALPASAVMKVFVVHGLARYRGTSWFAGSAALVAPRSSRVRLRRARPRKLRSWQRHPSTPASTITTKPKDRP